MLIDSFYNKIIKYCLKSQTLSKQRTSLLGPSGLFFATDVKCREKITYTYLLTPTTTVVGLQKNNSRT